YSLCGDPADRSAYRIAVLREDEGRGGSVAVHEGVRRGGLVRCSAPRDTFSFERAERYVFIAGGIGITPILPMLRAAEATGAEWTLHYAGRSPRTMAFGEELAGHGDHVVRYEASTGSRMDVPAVVAGAAA